MPARPPVAKPISTAESAERRQGRIRRVGGPRHLLETERLKRIAFLAPFSNEAGERPHALVGVLQQARQRRRLSRRLEVRRGEEQVVAVVVLRPELGIRGQAADAQVDNRGGKEIDALLEVRTDPFGMLEIGMADFWTFLSGQRGNEHPIVVDQLEVAARQHQHVAMLEIAMRHSITLEGGDQTPPLRGEGRQLPRVIEVLLDVV
jgi:hypothetical protein